MGKLKFLIIHCTATPEGKEIPIKTIRSWWRELGWKRDGYSDIIHLDGRIENLTEFDQDEFIDVKEMTYGAKGHNAYSRHVSYMGGMDKKMSMPRDTRTIHQINSLEAYVKYHIYRYQDIKVLGHNSVNPQKACPSFDVEDWLRNHICIPEKNIFSRPLELNMAKSVEESFVMDHDFYELFKNDYIL